MWKNIKKRKRKNWQSTKKYCEKNSTKNTTKNTMKNTIETKSTKNTAEMIDHYSFYHESYALFFPPLSLRKSSCVYVYMHRWEYYARVYKWIAAVTLNEITSVST